MKYAIIVLFLAFANLTSCFPKEKPQKKGLFHNNHNSYGTNNFNSGFGNRPTHGSVGVNYNGGLGGGLGGGIGAGLGVGLGGSLGGLVGGGLGAGLGVGHGSGLGGALGKPSSGCRYWCRTPQGQAYCCEDDNEPQSAVGVVKPGRCPPVRPVCPPTRSFGPPQTCSNDGACGGFDKCCFDTCLQEHVCKAPLGYGR